MMLCTLSLMDSGVIIAEAFPRYIRLYQRVAFVLTTAILRRGVLAGSDVKSGASVSAHYAYSYLLRLHHHKCIPKLPQHVRMDLGDASLGQLKDFCDLGELQAFIIVECDD